MTTKLCLLLLMAGLSYASSKSDTKAQIEMCSGVTEGNSVCNSCFEVAFCFGDGSFTSSCNTEASEACTEEGGNAFCVPSSEVTGCQCDVFPSFHADFYDPSKYYNCLESGVATGECDPNLVFDEEQKICVEDQNGIPPDPKTCGSSSSFDPGEIKLTKLDCFYYQVCTNETAGQPGEVYRCEYGDVYVESLQSCILYVEFTCFGKADGFYADSDDCTIFHYCRDQKEASVPYECPDTAQYYDPVGKKCQSDKKKCIANGCTVPVPNDIDCLTTSDTFAINSDSFYQCVDDGTGELFPLARECPEGFVFEATNGYCTAATFQPLMMKYLRTPQS